MECRASDLVRPICKLPILVPPCKGSLEERREGCWRGRMRGPRVQRAWERRVHVGVRGAAPSYTVKVGEGRRERGARCRKRRAVSPSEGDPTCAPLTDIPLKSTPRSKAQADRIRLSIYY
jgi:hypothetical protein